MKYTDIPSNEIDAVRNPVRKVRQNIAINWPLVALLIFAWFMANYAFDTYWDSLTRRGEMPPLNPLGSPISMFGFMIKFVIPGFVICGGLIVAAREGTALNEEAERQIGKADGRRAYLRGAALADLREYDFVFGRRFPEQPHTVRIAGVPIPPTVERVHMLISAGTGAGKSVALAGLLADIRARGDRAVVLDNGREFLGRFGRHGDVTVSAFDSSSPGWTLSYEVRAAHDWDRFAEALVPKAHGSAEEWAAMARGLFSAVGKNFERVTGSQPTNADLLHLLTSADMAEIEPFLTNTPAAMLASGDEKAASRLQNIRLSFLSSLQGLSSVKDGDFSFREWVKGEGADWLFLPYTDYEMSIARSLLATWLDIIVMSALEPSNSMQVKTTTWVVIDELDSLGAIPALVVGATRLRKAGFAIVAAVQDYSQLRETYGQNRSETIINNLSNKLVMRTDDGAACEALSRMLGEQEFEETRVSYSDSTSYSNSGVSQKSSSSGRSISTQTKKERVVLPSEIAHLPPGNGYLKFSGEWPILRVTVPLV